VAEEVGVGDLDVVLGHPVADMAEEPAEVSEGRAAAGRGVGIAHVPDDPKTRPDFPYLARERWRRALLAGLAVD
jgi:hypothetical protein